MSDAPLAGRTALVTGGATGVGRAIVDRLAADGAGVVVLTLATPVVPDEVKHFAAAGALDRLRDAATAWSGGLRIVEGDAADPAAIDRAVLAAAELGPTPVDILVLNAATNTVHDVVDHPVETWQRVLDVNVTGPFLAIRACLPGMLARRRGRIVGIASTDAHAGAAGYAAYCASKHALLGLLRSVSQEVEGTDIGVVSVSPSWIDTPSARLHLARDAAARGISEDEAVAGLLATLPQRRLIPPEEVAEVIAFAVSDAGRSMHGSDISLTGGATR